MKGAPIAQTKRIGLECGATRVAILMLDDDGNYAVTTWGKTKAQCGRLKSWSETHSESVLMEMFEQT